MKQSNPITNSTARATEFELVCTSGNLRKREISEASKNADQIIAEAHAKAGRILQRARQKAAILQKRTFEETKDAALKEIQSSLLAAREIRRNALNDAENDCLLLALKITGKIVGRMIELEPDIQSEIIAAAITAIRPNGRVTIRINPSEVLAVQRALSGRETSNGIFDSEVLGDRAVEPSRCFIDTPIGSFETGVETQLKIIAQILEEVRSTEPQSKILRQPE